MARMMELGNEYYPFASAAEGKRFANPPLGVRLKADSFVRGEIISVWGTQIAEEDQGVLLGQVPDAWKPVVERQREVFEAGIQTFNPATADDLRHPLE